VWAALYEAEQKRHAEYLREQDMARETEEDSNEDLKEEPEMVAIGTDSSFETLVGESADAAEFQDEQVSTSHFTRAVNFGLNLVFKSRLLRSMAVWTVAALQARLYDVQGGQTSVSWIKNGHDIYAPSEDSPWDDEDSGPQDDSSLSWSNFELDQEEKEVENGYNW
jgi:hypothetical protein